MARVARKSLESSFFHVIVQGYEKQYIFNETIFKDKYLELLLKELISYRVELLEYCIMSNHVHILLYCEEIDEMSKYMRSVNTQFALFYNKQKERVGYVFRDRFLSEPIKNEKHLYNCISYIHMNPVAANIVSRPNEYHYSSYNDFINKNGIVTDSVLIKLFGNSEKYIELFHIIHMSMGEGMEYLDDSGGVTLEKSQRIVRNILYDYGLKEEALNNDNICKYFYKKFIKNGVKKYHIEQIFNVNRRKINSILKT